MSENRRLFNKETTHEKKSIINCTRPKEHVSERHFVKYTSIFPEGDAFHPENERYIQEAINKLIQSKTLIVIAHRLPTIMHADQIVVIDEGVIVEKGRHDDLMSREGLYHSLWEKQKEAHGWTFGGRK